MNKEIIMKISAIIVSVITIYTVIIWEPKDNGEVLDKKINDTNDVVDNKTEEIDTDNFQINELESLNGTNNTSTNSDEEFAEGLGTIVANEKTFDDIIDKISSKEKDEIKEVLKNLSITDCSKIDVFLEQEDSTKGINEAFIFIRKRLSDKDYEKFQEIISKYIDITNIDSNI